MFNLFRSSTPRDKSPLTRKVIDRIKEGWILEGGLDPDYFRKAIASRPNAETFEVELEDFRKFKMEQYSADPERRHLDVAELVGMPGNAKLGEVLGYLANQLHGRSIL